MQWVKDTDCDPLLGFKLFAANARLLDHVEDNQQLMIFSISGSRLGIQNGIL